MRLDPLVLKEIQAVFSTGAFEEATMYGDRACAYEGWRAALCEIGGPASEVDATGAFYIDTQWVDKVAKPLKKAEEAWLEGGMFYLRSGRAKVRYPLLAKEPPNPAIPALELPCRATVATKEFVDALDLCSGAMTVAISASADGVLLDSNNQNEDDYEPSVATVSSSVAATMSGGGGDLPSTLYSLDYLLPIAKCFDPGKDKTLKLSWGPDAPILIEGQSKSGLPLRIALSHRTRT